MEWSTPYNYLPFTFLLCYNETMAELMESLELCDECGACLAVCPTYEATQKKSFHP